MNKVNLKLKDKELNHAGTMIKVQTTVDLLSFYRAVVSELTLRGRGRY